MHYKLPFMQLRKKIKYQVIRLLDIIIVNKLDNTKYQVFLGVTRDS